MAIYLLDALSIYPSDTVLLPLTPVHSDFSKKTGVLNLEDFSIIFFYFINNIKIN